LANGKVVILSVFCAILLIVSVFTFVMFSQKSNELNLKLDQISEIENDITSLELQVTNFETEIDLLESEILEKDIQISSLESDKTNYENDVTDLESQLSSIQAEKNLLINQKGTLENQLDSLQSQITDLEVERTSLLSEISNLQTQISSLEVEVVESYSNGYTEGEIEGYIQGVIDGAGRGYTIRDPTYSEAILFVDSDRTDMNPYIEGEYVCWNFAADFIENGSNQGYKVGFVYIQFPQSAHAIVCLNTTDNDLIFIEPQDDNIITELTIGEPYWDRDRYIVDYDDTIQLFEIIW
jgi:hypothetical protein